MSSNVGPGEDDVSAWCKLHGAEFKGDKIPFGALVYFKPSGARANEQAHKFDPKGIPGVFAGYEIARGINWRRQYMAWALSDMTKQNYSFNAKTTIDKLRHPHLTEKIQVHLPLTFPCKDIYEKVNAALEGLTVKDRLEGSPDFLEDQQDDDDDDEDDDDDGGDGKPKKSKITNKMEHQEEEFDRMLREMDVKLDNEKIDKVEVVGEPPMPPPDGEPPYDGPEHHPMGKAGDGIIYTSATLASTSSSTVEDDLIVLVLTVAKKYEGHQGQRAVTVQKNGELYPPGRGMSSSVVVS